MGLHMKIIKNFVHAIIAICLWNNRFAHEIIDLPMKIRFAHAIIDFDHAIIDLPK